MSKSSSDGAGVVHVAVVAASERVRRQVSALLAPAAPGAVIAPCRRVADLAPAELAAVDVVVCEDTAPRHSGLATLRRLRERRPETPVIVLARDGDAERALHAVRAGAAEALHKDEWATELLPQALRRALDRRAAEGAARERSRRLGSALCEAQSRVRELERVNEELRSAAITDPLTGLLNRRALEDRLEEHLASAARHGGEVSCLMLDVDGLKAVNDTLGHNTGDELLRALAAVIRATCRRSDTAARAGGDEFVVLLPRTNAAMAELLAKRLHAAFSRRVAEVRERLRAAGGPDVTVVGRARAGVGPRAIPGVSIGVACVSGGEAGAELLARADAALYAAKRSASGGVGQCGGGVALAA